MKEDKRVKEDVKKNTGSPRSDKQQAQTVPQATMAPQTPIVQHAPVTQQLPSDMYEMPVIQQMPDMSQMPIMQQMPAMFQQQPMICCPILMNAQCPMLVSAGMGLEQPMPYMGVQGMMHPSKYGACMRDNYMANPYLYNPGYMYTPDCMYSQDLMNKQGY